MQSKKPVLSLHNLVLSIVSYSALHLLLAVVRPGKLSPVQCDSVHAVKRLSDLPAPMIPNGQERKHSHSMDY